MQFFTGDVGIHNFLKYLLEARLSNQYLHLFQNHQDVNILMCVTRNRNSKPILCQFNQNFITNCLKWLVKLTKIVDKNFLLLGHNANHSIKNSHNNFERKGPLEIV